MAVSARVSSIWKFSFVQISSWMAWILSSAVAEIADGLDHLLGVAAGVELGFLEQAEAAREVADHFLPAVLEFKLAAAQFLQCGAFALQFLLRAFQLGEFLLRLDDLAVHFLAGRRAQRVGEGRAGRLVRLKIGVHKLRCIVFGSHVANLVLWQESVKRCFDGNSAPSSCSRLVIESENFRGRGMRTTQRKFEKMEFALVNSRCRF